MLGGLFGKLSKWIGVKIGRNYLREVAEGKYGEGWQKTYFYVIGKKAYTGFMLLCFSVALNALGHDSEQLAVVGAVLVALGLLDASWRNQTPEWFLQSSFYQTLAKHGTDIAVVLGIFAAKLSSCSAPFSWDINNCALQENILLVTASLLVYFNIIPAAWRNRPPFIPVDEWDHKNGVILPMVQPEPVTRDLTVDSAVTTPEESR